MRMGGRWGGRAAEGRAGVVAAEVRRRLVHPQVRRLSDEDGGGGDALFSIRFRLLTRCVYWVWRKASLWVFPPGCSSK